MSQIRDFKENEMKIFFLGKYLTRVSKDNDDDSRSVEKYFHFFFVTFLFFCNCAKKQLKCVPKILMDLKMLILVRKTAHQSKSSEKF